MNCRTAQHEMQCALDAPLTPPGRAHLDAHLNACPACRRAWADYRRLSREVSEWVARPDPKEMTPAQFTAQVLARLEACPASVAPWPRLLTAGAVAVLLAALSPWVSPWLPPAPHWEASWAVLPHLEVSPGVLVSRWAAAALLPALALNALFVHRARRMA